MFRSYRDTVRTPKADKSLTPEIYNCNMCTKGGWHSENDMEIHKKQTHFLEMHECKNKHKDRFCTICMTLQDSKKVLIEHIKSHHLLSSPQAKRVERKIYICNECTHIFFNKDVLAIHMLYVHITKKYERKNKDFTCPKCSKVCRLKSIWFHLQNHDVPSVSMCDICLTNFPSRAALYKHVETHKGYYKCEPCGYISTQPEPFNLHLLEHAQKQVPHGRVPHEVLKSVFTRHKDNIARYNVHNTLKGLNLPRCIEICTLCREMCLTQLETKQHVLRDHTHEKVEKKRHLCACGEEFYYKVVLKQHVMKMKGQHRPVAYAELKEKMTNQRRMLNSLLSPDKLKVQNSIGRCLVVCAERLSEDLIAPGVVLVNEDARNVNKVELELCNKIEIEISNQIVNTMDYDESIENSDTHTDTVKKEATE